MKQETPEKSQWLSGLLWAEDVIKTMGKHNGKNYLHHRSTGLNTEFRQGAFAYLETPAFQMMPEESLETDCEG